MAFWESGFISMICRGLYYNTALSPDAFLLCRQDETRREIGGDPHTHTHTYVTRYRVDVRLPKQALPPRNKGVPQNGDSGLELDWG